MKTTQKWIAVAGFAALGLGIAWAADNNFGTPGGSTAPGAVNMCLNTLGQAVACSASSPLQISGSITASSAAVGLTGAAVPTSADFIGISIGGNLTGVTGFSVGTQRVPGIAIVDGSGAQITTFGGAATTSNASSSIATSGNNQAAVVWNYGWNGATWDQLQVDANKYLKVASQASELHIGEVGGNLMPIVSSVTTSNNTVTSGKAIGGLQTLTNAVRVSGALGAGGTSGLIQGAVLAFKDAIGTVPMDIYYFNANPTGTTCTDNATFALPDADRAKVVWIAHVTDWTAGNTSAIGQAGNLAAAFGVASATSIYACIVTRASAATTTGSNLSLTTNILRN